MSDHPALASQQPRGRWTRDYFAPRALEVAPHLLGAVVQRGPVQVRLTEVEAYAGVEDPGSHAFRGPTPRTEVMFGAPGHAYVYLSYGMHHCLNVVCGPGGVAGAILLRAGEVIAGEAQARQRRDAGRATPHPARDLARGPARLTQALGVDLAHDGLDLCETTAELLVHSGHRPEPSSIRSGARVGVSGPGGDATAYPWRFWVHNEPTVSTYRPGRMLSARRR